MDRAEAGSVGISLLAHAALFGLMALAVGRPDPTIPPPAMEVSFVEGEVGLTSASPVQSPPEQGMAPEAGPPEDSPAEPERPLPDLRPVPAEPQAPPRQAEQRRQQTRPSPPRQQTAPAERTRRSLIGDDILKGIGRDPSPSRSQQAPAAMTGEARASMNALIARALARCEEQTFPSPEARAIRVTVRVTLNPDGSLASAVVTGVGDYDSRLSHYEQRMRDLALAVVRECTPIRGLPAQYYDVPRGWRQFSYQFPRRS
jgi:outer membrane biosynthesis protein TonB